MRLSREGAPYPYLDGESRQGWLQGSLFPGLDYSLVWQDSWQAMRFASDSNGIALHARVEGFQPTLRLKDLPWVFAGGRWALPTQGLRSSQGMRWFLLWGPDETSHGGSGKTMTWQDGLYLRLFGDWDMLPLSHSATLQGHAPLSLPGRMQVHQAELHLGLVAPSVGVESRTRWIRMRPLPESEGARATSTSASFLSQGEDTYWRRAFGLPALTLAMRGDATLGYGTEQGFQRQGRSSHGFAYAPCDLAMGRLSLLGELNLWEWSWSRSVQVEGLRGRLLMPLDPANHWLWNRNPILDAYQGSITGLFDRETWLGLGRAEAWEWDFGLQAERILHHGRIRIPGCSRLDMHRYLSQALPLDAVFQWLGEESFPASEPGTSKSRNSGGLRWRLEFRWFLPSSSDER